jgi:hypothetical protein
MMDARVKPAHDGVNLQFFGIEPATPLRITLQRTADDHDRGRQRADRGRDKNKIASRRLR